MIVFDRETGKTYEPVMLRIRLKRNLTPDDQARCRIWFDRVADGYISHDGHRPIDPERML